eukprot:scaffold179_cov368-Prasinococcus_capsulatus_cf.AAC.10
MRLRLTEAVRRQQVPTARHGHRDAPPYGEGVRNGVPAPPAFKPALTFTAEPCTRLRVRMVTMMLRARPASPAPAYKGARGESTSPQSE